VKKKRGAPRRRTRALARKALALAPLPNFLPLPGSGGPTALTSDPLITAAFIGTLQLTEGQIAALRRPVADSEIEWKPAEKDGPPVIPYLSHNGYRDRLDAAFGLGGWGMVPVGMPKEKDGAIFAPYALCIGGVPRVYAWGEQQLHKMSYGDGIEGAKSNAITRCGKELGIGRELWNRMYIAALKTRRHASPAPPPYVDVRAAEPITEPQRLRLWTIVKKSGRPKTEVAMWLTARYQITDSSKITRRDYPAIIEQLERPGSLTLPDEEKY
jgi:hypothetical protein